MKPKFKDKEEYRKRIELFENLLKEINCGYGGILFLFSYDNIQTYYSDVLGTKEEKKEGLSKGLEALSHYLLSEIKTFVANASMAKPKGDPNDNDAGKN